MKNSFTDLKLINQYLLLSNKKGTYSLPPVPEAAEYELGSDNSSSSTSTSREEMINNMESDYQIEHGQVCSPGVNPKKVCQVIILF
jgi:hypothetical protein